MSTKNLWGDLKDLETVRTPKTVLKEQAQILTEATDGILVGDVRESEIRGEFLIYLEIKVPALNNYTYTVMSVRHSIDMYPARVNAEKPNVSQVCDNEEDFTGVVETVLSSDEMKTIVSRLLAQAN